MPDYVFLLVPFVFFAAAVVILAWLGRRTSRPPNPDPRPLVVAGGDAGHFFFLPNTQEAWAEVCRSAETSEDPAAGPWSHPLIGEALEDAVPTIRDGDIRLTYVEFCRVYALRRDRRLDHCSAAYLQRI